MVSHTDLLNWLRTLLPDWLLDFNPPFAALFVLAVGIAFGFVLGKLLKRLLDAADVPDAVEGTAFDRMAQRLGFSTAALLARLPSWFVYGVAILMAISLVQPAELDFDWLVQRAWDLFVAVVVLITGFVVADKSELLVSERLRSVKLPEVTIVPQVVKYSILYIALLITLEHLRVHTTALLIVLVVYLFGVVFLTAIATQSLLTSGAAGIYLLLNQPYGIGDEVRIGDRQGVVQEVDVLVTRLEDGDEEFVVPNAEVFEQGVARQLDA